MSKLSQAQETMLALMVSTFAEYFSGWERGTGYYVRSPRRGEGRLHEHPFSRAVITALEKKGYIARDPAYKNRFVLTFQGAERAKTCLYPQCEWGGCEKLAECVVLDGRQLCRDHGTNLYVTTAHPVIRRAP